VNEEFRRLQLNPVVAACWRKGNTIMNRCFTLVTTTAVQGGTDESQTQPNRQTLPAHNWVEMNTNRDKCMHTAHSRECKKDYCVYETHSVRREREGKNIQAIIIIIMSCFFFPFGY
jgi:hypothetical protein